MQILKEHRLGDGRWRRFPFYYTLLALAEMKGKVAAAELQYAAPVLERVMKRRARGEKYDSRRRLLAERILARV